MGLMSGTSMDGLDMACCTISDDDDLKLELIAFTTHAFPASLQARLHDVSEMRAHDLMLLDHDLGRFYADAVEDFASEKSFKPDLIGCHGQTIAHKHGEATWQIGEPSFLAERLNCPVVSHFRQQDVAAGGCGAPLVPATDLYLFADVPPPALILNIGGIANVTWLGGLNGSDINGFDTGPGNMMLDELVRRYSHGRQTYDRDGAMASRGAVHTDWLHWLNAHPFLQKSPPRSAGAEDFGLDYVDRFLSFCAPETETDWHNVVATTSAWTVQTISGAITDYLPITASRSPLVVCGGGGYNTHLVKGLQECHQGKVIRSDNVGVPMDAREAMAFALLAVMRMREMPANCPEVTGANRPVCLGKVTRI